MLRSAAICARNRALRVDQRPWRRVCEFRGGACLQPVVARYSEYKRAWPEKERIRTVRFQITIRVHATGNVECDRTKLV